ncbi:shikimate kinase [Metabacillus sp. 113a]|uniref:shikimate kinase n=1 Tax=Metabacillus sp. 113a TaxID=3404706 RepID=UPI003CF2CACA
MERIILTGFMGAGKTTAGKALGNRLSVPVYDTDVLLEQKLGMSMNEIFDQFGEEEFRRKETAMLRELPEGPAVITTGGGIVMKEENRELLKQKGRIFYLSCEFNALYERLKEDTTRPLLKEKTKEQIYQLFESRMSAYEEGAIVIETTGKNPKEIAADIAARL